MSKAEWHTDERGDLHFSGVLRAADLQRLRLDPLDRMVVNEPFLTAADLFQSLEIIFRRMQQETERRAAATAA